MRGFLVEKLSIGACRNLMRKLLSSPVKMPLSDAENVIYQNALKYITELSLNLMAVKVSERAESFLGWCQQLQSICAKELNMELLEPAQLPALKKLQDILIAAISIGQVKMTRIAPWPIYSDFITQQSSLQSVTERLSLLSHIKEIRETPLAEMLPEDKLAYIGKHSVKHDPSVYTFDVEWFASTKGAKLFHQLISEKPSAFDSALSHIPLEGEITFLHYEQFVTQYSEIFANFTDNKAEGEKAPLAPATRLLAMRRPDQFIALSNAKIDLYCQALSIVKFDKSDFKSYWFDLIMTMRSCAWWLQPQPEDATELTLWQNRAVFVDCFFFADESYAAKSNYIKLRDKPKASHVKSKASSNLARKRSKESAEMLVDIALTADDMPEYMLSKRDSIIKQVVDGKSVDHAISLMRAIFG